MANYKYITGGVVNPLINKFTTGGEVTTSEQSKSSEPIYYDFIDPSVVKAFKSNEEYNRYYGEQFGKQVAKGMNEAAPQVLQATMLPLDLVGTVELPMLLYKGVKAAPTLYKMGKQAIKLGKKKLGKKAFGMIDDIAKR